MPSEPSRRPGPPSTGGTLGTFAGVFTPSLLTILGIILFLRLGYVTGSAGFGRMLLILALANVISVLTSISLSAVATNLKVKGGGDYYLISRTLGLTYGGALGLVLFLAQAVSIAFYTIGFGEAVSAVLPGLPAACSPRAIAAGAVLMLFGLAWMGADWATRFQYVVMALLAAALVSFFVGAVPAWEAGLLVENWSPSPGSPAFWTLFAIFFPAVTGFTQGVSMSGDLKDPGRSLPAGTFAAVGISIVVYFASAAVFAGVLPNAVMAGDTSAMRSVARWAPLIDAGVVAATLSSAMASFLGAPRVLKSLAADRIFPFLLPFAKGAGPLENPRRGVLLSAAIALGVISLGNLNLIAPVVSMFFLISYGLLNYATYFEARTESPSFRPRFKWFHRRLSLAGFAACLAVMLAINPQTGVVAVSVLFGIFQYVKRTAGPARWADSRRAYHLQRARENLRAASADPEHPRDWRPQILAFSNDPERRTRLLQAAAWLEGRSGMTTLVQIIEGQGVEALRRRNKIMETLQRDLAANPSPAFPLVMATPDFESGVYALLQCAGVGPLRVNTILLNWLNPDSHVAVGFKEFLFGRHLRAVHRLGCSVAILHTDENRWRGLLERATDAHRIDVLWQNDATSRMVLLFAYLMTRSEPWSEAAIRVIVRAGKGDRGEAVGDLRKALEEVRIEAEPLVADDFAPPTLAELCGASSLVCLPFRLSGNTIVGPSEGRVEELLLRLPTAMLFLAAEDIDLDAEPEEGAAAEAAAAADAAVDAEKAAERAEADVETAREAALAARRETIAAEFSVTGGDAPKDSKRRGNEALSAEKDYEKAVRRAARMRAKADDALRRAEALGADRSLVARRDGKEDPSGEDGPPGAEPKGRLP